MIYPWVHPSGVIAMLLDYFIIVVCGSSIVHGIKSEIEKVNGIDVSIWRNIVVNAIPSKLYEAIRKQFTYSIINYYCFNRTNYLKIIDLMDDSDKIRFLEYVKKPIILIYIHVVLKRVKLSDLENILKDFLFYY